MMWTFGNNFAVILGCKLVLVGEPSSHLKSCEIFKLWKIPYNTQQRALSPCTRAVIKTPISKEHFLQFAMVFRDKITKHILTEV